MSQIFMKKIVSNQDFAIELMKLIEVSDKNNKYNIDKKMSELTRQDIIYSLSSDYDYIYNWLKGFIRYLDKNEVEDWAYIRKAQSLIDFLEKEK